MDNDISHPSRPKPGHPTTVFITACEALTWIAWGDAKTFHDVTQDGVEVALRWGTARLCKLPLVLEALEARAARRPLQQEEFGPDPILSPDEGPRVLRAIRARARQRTGCLLSFADLASELRGEIEDIERKQVLLQSAADVLMEALRASKITAFGRRRHSGGQANPGAPHDHIPVGVLIHPSVTIELSNQFSVGPPYDDVRFETADVLALSSQVSVAKPNSRAAAGIATVAARSNAAPSESARDDSAQPAALWNKRVKQAGTTNKALTAWVEDKYPGGIPGRDALLEDHQNDFGRIAGISQRNMRFVRTKLASQQAKRGGRPRRQATTKPG